MEHPATIPVSVDSSDIDWFDVFCDLLKREKQPTFDRMLKLLGTPKQYPPRERRGSLFLEPFDKRFSYVAINPDVNELDTNLPLEHIGLGGPRFSLAVADLLVRFPRHKTKCNIYDGGYQIFFHPVQESYEFTALSVSTDKEDISDIRDLIVNNVSFDFGNVLVEYKDGFAMKRIDRVKSGVN